ncbi:uncharacterized protein [Parasteatoda tepidariorum]|uniref:uncharacterized protein n=1 Tax=Parasteatoda tepidariorum TaxID=114398 RepID=UPI00077FBF54|nr:uncharacterized protein LOC107440748 [Parasteatoda tepidariorum]
MDMNSNEFTPNSPSLQMEFRPRRFSDISDLMRKERFQNDLIHFKFDRTTKEKIRKLAEYILETESRDNGLGEQSHERIKVFDELKYLFDERFRILLKRVEDWKLVRIPLIKKIEDYIESLDKNFKLSSIARLVGSTTDVVGSVGGLLMSSDSAKYAFNIASACGLLGIFATVAEITSSKKILDDVNDSIEEDYKSLDLIVKWFHGNEDLDFAVQDSRIFPYGVDKDIALQVQEASHELEDYMKVFVSALASNVRKDSDILEDIDFLHGLQMFTWSNVARLWWNRIIFRKHPITLDLNRMMLQMEFGQMQSLVLQSIPSLPLEQQRLTSLPVAGRIMLNCLTIYDSMFYIRQGAKSLHSDKLRKLLKEMKRELRTIDSLIERMKPANFSEQVQANLS